MTTIGERIRKYRKEKGWTQSQLAEETDLLSVYISAYENGRWMPNILNMIAIADAFEVSLDELVGRRVNNERTDWRNKEHKIELI